MFREAFTKLEPSKASALTAFLNPHFDIDFDPARAAAMVHNLSFYPGYFLAEISDHGQNPPLMRVAVCKDGGGVQVLDWSNAPIYALNASVPIQLTDANASDYVRFFLTYSRGRHGRFLIVDTVDDIDWKEEPAPAGRKALAKMIQPLAVKERRADGVRVFTGSIVFKDSLFVADILVHADGRVEMENEELLVEAIPVADDIFGI